MPSLHNLSNAQIQSVQQKSEHGDYAGAWNALYGWGDHYADDAAQVVGQPTSRIGLCFSLLVKNHWSNVAGVDAYDKKFLKVAKRHLDNYINILIETPYWPNTKQIEQSYRDAVTAENLPAQTAIDGMFSNSLGDIFGAEWEDFLNIPEDRIVDSDVFDDLGTLESTQLLLADTFDTIGDIIKISGWELLYYPMFGVTSEETQ